MNEQDLTPARRQEVADAFRRNTELAGLAAAAQYEADSIAWVNGHFTLDELIKRGA